MGSQKLLLIGLAAVTVGIIGFALFLNSRSSSQIVNGSVAAENPEFLKRYLPYSEANLARALQNNGKPVIFFHAVWCPTCQAAEADFRANFDKVPENVTILKTDYDTSKELKQKYNVVYQDTFVQVDNQGKEVTKWGSGGQGVNALLANLR